MSADSASLCPDFLSACIASPRVLIIDAEPSVRSFLHDFFTGLHLEVEEAVDVFEARRSLRRSHFDLVMADTMAPEQAGLKFVRELQAQSYPPATLLMASSGSVEMAVEAMRSGAADFHVKPLDPVRLRQSIDAALASRQTPLLFDAHWSRLQEALSQTASREAQLRLITKTAESALGDVAVSLQRSDRADATMSASSVGQAPCLRLEIPYGGQVKKMLVCVGRTRAHPFFEGEKTFMRLLASQVGLIFEATILEEARAAVAAQTMQALARALEAKDAYTFGHSDRVAFYAARLAQKLGLPPADVARLHQGGLMHDIGKIGIRSSDLNTQGPLTWEQKTRFRMHPVFGRNIVEPMAALHPLIPAIYHHHEAYDGTGYPDGLVGEKIPLDARILSVADSYDAMTSDRSYRPKMSDAAARAELARCAGTQFDPQIVDAFLAMATPMCAATERSGATLFE